MLWVRIRAFGELQILTRASYFMILFVPILAGLWPAVRIGLNRYNQAVTDAKAALEAASERIELVTLTDKLEGETQRIVSETVAELTAKVDSLIADYSIKTIENVDMPIVWGVTFFASLSVTVGHLIYQSLAPDLIKQKKLQDHVNDELEKFTTYRTDDHLKRAYLHLQDRFRNRKPSPNIEVLFGMSLSEIAFTDMLKEFEPIAYPKEKRDVDDHEESGSPSSKELELVERGAQAEYRSRADENRYSGLICGIFYGFGAVGIFYIVCEQSFRVLAVIGW